VTALNPHFIIRPLNPQKDMPVVADLIEMCFGAQLDPDGFTYLAQIRKAAKDQRLIRWLYTAGEKVSYPLNGYVCEVNGRVIGNLSIIPYYWKREWYYLIANVAVHPDFRRQGAAHSLTAKALEHLRRLPIRAAWLHVREDNLPARRLYESFHFSARCLRDTWISSAAPGEPAGLAPGEAIEPPRREDWQAISDSLSAWYPPEVAWHLNFDLNRYKPGWLAAFMSFFSDEKTKQWTFRVNGQPAGAAILEKSSAYADQIFLAVPPQANGKATRALLPFIRASHSPERKLMINLPAHTLENTLPQAGFELSTRLFWMEIRINE
jgi:GNAT superfamily N-acetyltransferase